MSILDGAFKNITRASDPVKQGVGGQAYLDNILALQVGHGSVTMKSNKNGLWLGAKKSTDAPFYVDMNGNVVATSINLGGEYIETGGAANDINVGGVKVIGTQIVSLSITSTQISDGAISTPKLQANAVTANEIAANAITAGKIAANAIEADKISANAITSVKILAGAITADKIFVSTLSAISANLGAITAGTISGVTITSTAAAGGRIVLDSGNYLRFYGGGAERSRLRGVNAGGAVGIIDELGSFAVTREQGFIAASNTSNTDFFKFYCNSSAQGIIQLPNSNVFRMLSSDGLTNELTYSEANGFFSNRRGLFNAQLSVNGALTCKEIFLNYGQNEGSIRNLDWLEGYNDLYLKCQGTNFIKFDSSTNDSGTDDLAMYPHWGDFYATGTKFFRIPHPEHPDDGWIQYVSVEAPEVFLTIRGRGKLVGGTVKITLPHHWSLVTEELNTTVMVTPLGNCKGLFVPKAQLNNENFTVKELQNGNSNVDFMWEMSATRKGYGEFNPEQTLEDDADRMVKYLVSKEKNRKKFIADTQSKEERYDKIKKLTRQKYETLTGKELVNGGDERPRLEAKRLKKLGILPKN